MYCSILDWKFFMIASTSGTEEKIWRLEMSRSQGQTFRKHLETLGIVQTDLSAQFKFKKFIGEGAFSDVYLAQQVETKSKFAAKVTKLMSSTEIPPKKEAPPVEAEVVE